MCGKICRVSRQNLPGALSDTSKIRNKNSVGPAIKHMAQSLQASPPGSKGPVAQNARRHPEGKLRSWLALTQTMAR
jgi:hypothetical protein